MESNGLFREIAESPWFCRPGLPYLVVDTDLRIRAVNSAFEHVTDHPREALIGEPFFSAFPDNPADPRADGVARLSASLESVFRGGERHWMGVQRHDVPDRSQPGRFRLKVWAPVNSPLHHDGRVAAVLHHAEDVTTVLAGGPRSLLWRQISRSAQNLWRQFPTLPYEAVLGVLAQSHGVVMSVLGQPDRVRSEELATVRLELLAGHPRLGPPVSSHLRPPDD